MMNNGVIKEIMSIKDSVELLLDEEDRILSICYNGGLHLKSFKPENRTYYVCLTAVMRDGMDA